MIVKPPLAPRRWHPEWQDFTRPLVGAWLFDACKEAVDGLEGVPDYSPYGTHGIFRATTALSVIDGDQGRAINFAGSSADDCIDLETVAVSNPLSLAGLTRWTFLARCERWVQGNTQWQRVLQKNNGFLWIYYSTGSTTQINIQIGGVSDFSDNLGLSNNDINHIGVTHDLSRSPQSKYFLDGEVVTTANPNHGAVPSQAGLASIGNVPSGSARQFRGQIPYIYVFNDCLEDELVRRVAMDPYGWLRVPPAPLWLFTAPGPAGVAPQAHHLQQARRAACA